MILKHRLLLQPIDPAYAAGLRHHEGIPSIAVSPVNGRLWATWYASNTGCEDANNYVVLSTSADGGRNLAGGRRVRSRSRRAGSRL